MMVLQRIKVLCFVKHVLPGTTGMCLARRKERSLHSDAWVSRGRGQPVLTAGAALLVTRVPVLSCAGKTMPALILSFVPTCK